MKDVHIVQNALFIPEKDIYLKSSHVHDFDSYALSGESVIFTDGGLSYIRRSQLPAGRVIKWDLYSNDSFETVAQRLLWQTFGPKGDQPGRHRPISTLELDHLKAILATQGHIRGTIYEEVVRYWIEKKEGKA